MTDTPAAISWLLSWAPKGPWTIVEIDPEISNPRVIAHTFIEDQLQRLTDHIDSRNGKLNLYFVPNPHVPHLHPSGYHTTPRKQDITSTVTLMVDLDLVSNAEQTEDNIGSLVRRALALQPPPTAVVYSGGGIQAYWILATPLPTEITILSGGTVSIGPAELTERVSKSIANSLRSDAIQNINRLMRLPGTINIPNQVKRAKGRRPALASVVYADWSKTWSPEDGEPTLPADYWVGDAQPSGSSNHNYGDLPQKWRNLIRTGDATEYANDRSRLVYAVVGQLVRRSWTDEEIISLLINAEYKISDHVLAQSNPQAYARRQIEHMRTSISQDWDRDPRTGAILNNSPSNLSRAMDEIGYRFRYNEFSGSILINGATPQEVKISDHHVSDIRVNIHDRFKFLPVKDVLHDTVVHLARSKTFNPVLEYFEDCVSGYDKIPRIDRWLTNYFKVPDSPYTRAVGRLMLVATVRRVRHPGCKFDEMLVLMSNNEGLGKSSGIKSLVPDEDWYTDSIPLRAEPRETIELLEGKVIAEYAELTGIQHQDVERIKAFLSRTTDAARRAYGRFNEEIKRRCTFWGTTNNEAFLRDRRNRRFWPCTVPDGVEVDLVGIARDRDQLWAEAAMAEATGESIRLDRALWVEAAEKQEEFRYGDAWVDFLTPYLLNHPTLGEVTGVIPASEVWRLLGKPGHNRSPSDNARLTECMRELGWLRKIKRYGIANTPTRSFVKGEDNRSVYVISDIVTGKLSIAYILTDYRREDGFDFTSP